MFSFFKKKAQAPNNIESAEKVVDDVRDEFSDETLVRSRAAIWRLIGFGHYIAPWQPTCCPCTI
ncbi:hypothetical protein [Pararhizobium sp. PWRC1-1]|uniref:hypothetical protein n=1 Tax=Pararhizobium sp. PWRC1-1 TaxID=2804566 RepID=UPI003CF60C5C